jgi:uncharacterized damage-inducible protein DinB
MPERRAPGVIDVLLVAIDRAFDRKSWHGTNLCGSIRGLSAGQAAWRPGPGRHSIHEIVLHAAYWKYVVRRRIRGEKRGSFPRAGSNWWTVNAASESAWKEDVALLADAHRSLRDAVQSLYPRDLARKLPGGTTDALALVTGIAAHDVYHAGQIQFIKRLGAAAAWRSRAAVSRGASSAGTR